MLGNPNTEITLTTMVQADGRPCPSPAFFGPDRIDNPCAAMHYWSLHSGGGNWLMGDGSVRFFANRIDPRLLQAMSTRNGEEVVQK